MKMQLLIQTAFESPANATPPKGTLYDTGVTPVRTEVWGEAKGFYAISQYGYNLGGPYETEGEAWDRVLECIRNHPAGTPENGLPLLIPPTLKILSITAIRDIDGSWTWDSWMEVGSVGMGLLDKSTRGLLKYLREEGFLSQNSVGKVAIEDDQYNLVVVDRSTRQPLYALEYGNEH